MGQALIHRAPAPKRRAPGYAWSSKGWPIEFRCAVGEGAQIYCYTDKYSYAAGEIIQIHASCTTDLFDVAIVRDGARSPDGQYRPPVGGDWRPQ